MGSVLVAALVVRLTAAGGAGAGADAELQRRQAGDTWEDVRKDFAALRKEVSTLETEFREARERHRVEAERQHQQQELERRGQP